MLLAWFETLTLSTTMPVVPLPSVALGVGGVFGGKELVMSKDARLPLKFPYALSNRRSVVPVRNSVSGDISNAPIANESALTGVPAVIMRPITLKPIP